MSLKLIIGSWRRMKHEGYNKGCVGKNLEACCCALCEGTNPILALRK